VPTKLAPLKKAVMIAARPTAVAAMSNGRRTRMERTTAEVAEAIRTTPTRAWMARAAGPSATARANPVERLAP
jgi:hypothetical protein